MAFGFDCSLPTVSFLDTELCNDVLSLIRGDDEVSPSLVFDTEDGFELPVVVFEDLSLLTVSLVVVLDLLGSLIVDLILDGTFW